MIAISDLIFKIPLYILGAVLIVLAILAFLLLFALFFPFGYRVDISKSKAGSPIAKARLRWTFLEFINIFYRDGVLSYRFHIPVLLNKKGELFGKKRAAHKNAPSKGSDAGMQSGPPSGRAEASKYNTASGQERESWPEGGFEPERELDFAGTMESESSAEPIVSTEADMAAESIATSEPPVTTEPERESAAERLIKLLKKPLIGIKKLSGKIVGFIKGIYRILTGIIDGIQKVFRFVGRALTDEDSLKNRFFDLLNKESTKYSIDLLKREGTRLYKKISPRVVKGNIDFGFEDPYDTGWLFCIMAMAYPIYGGHIYINPSFEEKLFSGDILVKGRFSLFSFLRCFLKLYLDKRFKGTIREFREFDFSI